MMHRLSCMRLSRFGGHKNSNVSAHRRPTPTVKYEQRQTTVVASDRRYNCLATFHSFVCLKNLSKHCPLVIPCCSMAKIWAEVEH